MMSDRNEKAQSAGEAASFWFARLRAGNVSSAERRKFEHWLEQRPENEAAYAASEAAWDIAGDAAADDGLMEMRRQALSMRPESSWPHWRLYTGLAASVLVAVIVGLLLLPDFTANFSGGGSESSYDRLVFRTAVGQRSTVTLLDGSTVELNTDSRIVVRYDDSQRRVLLERGQALFDVAGGQPRPFVVEADDKLITAHGTSFDVRRLDDKVQVTLLEGEVTVESEAGILSYFAEPDSRTLAPGDQLIAVGGQPFEIRKPDVERVVSWSEGLLIFVDEPLSQAVSEINRYSLRKIVLGEESMKELRIGGVFEPGSVTGFTAALETAFPLTGEVDEKRNVVVLQWREPYAP